MAGVEAVRHHGNTGARGWEHAVLGVLVLGQSFADALHLGV